MANYLITGGTGLIGSALIEKLQQSPGNIFVLTRDRKKVGSKLGYVVTAIESLHELSNDTPLDAVINLAGEPIADKRWSMAQKLEIWRSRVEATDALVDWLKHRPQQPQVMLSGSAVGWYGAQGEKILTETSQSVDEYQHKLCEAWEKSAEKAEQYGIRVCTLRTGLVLSSRGGFLEKMKLPFKLGLGARIGNGEQYMPWVHIDDMINAMLLLLDPSEEDKANCRGPYNLTAPEPVTNQEFTQVFAASLNKRSFLVIPSFALKLGLGELSHLLLTGQRAIPERLTEMGFKFQFTTLESALKDVTSRW